MAPLRGSPALAMPASQREALAARRENARLHPVLKDDTEGNISGAVLGIILAVIGAVIVVAVLAALAPTWFTSIAGITGVFTSGNYSTGDTTADSIMPVFGTLIAFLGLLAFLGLVFVAVKLRGSGGV